MIHPTTPIMRSRIASSMFVSQKIFFERGSVIVASASNNKERAPRGAPFIVKMAEWTGLEPATPGVTGRYSNQLNYHSTYVGGC